jgi:hypothetical protein
MRFSISICDFRKNAKNLQFWWKRKSLNFFFLTEQKTSKFDRGSEAGTVVNTGRRRSPAVADRFLFTSKSHPELFPSERKSHSHRSPIRCVLYFRRRSSNFAGSEITLRVVTTTSTRCRVELFTFTERTVRVNNELGSVAKRNEDFRSFHIFGHSRSRESKLPLEDWGCSNFLNPANFFS